MATAELHCRSIGEIFRRIDMVDVADLVTNVGGFLRDSKIARLSLKTLANIPFNFLTTKIH